MNISDETIFLRVDDRLIHGQVVTSWVKSMGTRTIYVISDRAAAEPLEVVLLKSSVPAHIELDVLTMEQALTVLAEGIRNKTMLLLERIADAVTLCSAFEEIRNVNLGGLRYRPGKVSLNRAVYVAPEESEDLRALETSGVSVWLQIVPTDPKVLATNRLAHS